MGFVFYTVQSLYQDFDNFAMTDPSSMHSLKFFTGLLRGIYLIGPNRSSYLAVFALTSDGQTEGFNIGYISNVFNSDESELDPKTAFSKRETCG